MEAEVKTWLVACGSSWDVEDSGGEDSDGEDKKLVSSTRACIV